MSCSSKLIRPKEVVVGTSDIYGWVRSTSESLYLQLAVKGAGVGWRGWFCTTDCLACSENPSSPLLFPTLKHISAHLLSTPPPLQPLIYPPISAWADFSLSHSPVILSFIFIYFEVCSHQTLLLLLNCLYLYLHQVLK